MFSALRTCRNFAARVRASEPAQQSCKSNGCRRLNRPNRDLPEDVSAASRTKAVSRRQNSKLATCCYQPSSNYTQGQHRLPPIADNADAQSLSINMASRSAARDFPAAFALGHALQPANQHATRAKLGLPALSSGPRATAVRIKPKALPTDEARRPEPGADGSQLTITGLPIRTGPAPAPTQAQASKYLEQAANKAIYLNHFALAATCMTDLS